MYRNKLKYCIMGFFLSFDGNLLCGVSSGSGTNLCSVLHQLHPAIFQVDETDSHPAKQLQMFRVVCHEVLSPQGRTAHTRFPKKECAVINEIHDPCIVH